MLQIYHSNHLDILEEITKFIIDHNKLCDPFNPEVILIENTAIAKWLETSLSQKFGIAANINFLIPENFIWNIFSCFFSEVPKKNFFNKKEMSWKFMSLLPSILSFNEFFMLRNYLNEDINKKKLFKLSVNLANLYNRYLIYRHEWITYWESGKIIKDLPESQIWQAILWKNLIEYIKELGQPTWHWTNLYNKMISLVLKNKKNISKKLPSRIFIYNIPTLPPMFLKILKLLSYYMDIHILSTNPCRYYWGDIQNTKFLKIEGDNKEHFNEDNIISSNSLLSSWGKVGKDYIHMLSEITLLNNSDIEAFSNIKKDSLLHSLQNDILELENFSPFEFNNSKKHILNINDHSIVINICYSIQREVEVLHDQLLAILEEDPKLKLGEIIVMVANIDNYAPYIQAVFDGAIGKRYLPYVISDQSIYHSNPIVPAFIKLISLFINNISLEDVFSLLSIPEISKRFNINEEQYFYLLEWINEFWIYFRTSKDYDKNTKSFLNENKNYQICLTRMILDYEKNYRNSWMFTVFPYKKSKKLTIKLIRNFTSLLILLNYWKNKLNVGKTPSKWFPIYKEIINDFFLPDNESKIFLSLVEEHWKDFIEESVISQYTKEITLSLIYDELNLRLNKATISKYFTPDSINICAFMSIRSVPFKIIYLLGMNEGIFPRSIAPFKFDLTNHQPRLGDKNCQDDDRYFFLQTLISAEQKLSISYIGRSVQDNSKYFPSVVVKELIDYISHSYYLPGDENLDYNYCKRKIEKHIIVTHSYMPFDPTNYIPSRKQSYVREWLPTAKKKKIKESNFIQSLEPLSIDKVDIERLHRFWIHPVRAFFQMRLKVDFYYKKNTIFYFNSSSLKMLRLYKFNQKLLNILIEKKNIKELFDYYQSSELVPIDSFEKITWKEQYEEIQLLADQVIKHKQTAVNLKVNLHCNGIYITGDLKHVQKNGLLRWRPTLLNISQGIKLWIEHLIYCSIGGNGKSCIFFRRNQKWYFPSLSKDIAMNILEKLVLGYKRGMSKPLLFLPESGGAWIQTCYDKKNNVLVLTEEMQKKAKINFFRVYNGNIAVRGEGEDFWYQRLWKSPSSEDLLEIIRESKKYLLPLFRFHQSNI